MLTRPAGIERELLVAAFRHPIELETPDALNWTDAVVSVLPTPPQNVTAETTHDSVIVRFDKQPLGPGGIVVVRGDGVPGRESRGWIEDGASGRHEIEVGGLSPDTPVRVAVATGRLQDTLGIEPLRLRTKPAPDGWIEPGRGVRNLRVSATPTSVTAQWEAPPGEQEHWWTVSVLEILGSDTRDIDYGAVFSDFDDGPPFKFTTSGGGVYHRVRPGGTYQFRIGEIFFGGSVEPTLITITTPRQADDSPSAGGQADSEFELFPNLPVPELAVSWSADFGAALGEMRLKA